MYNIDKTLLRRVSEYTPDFVVNPAVSMMAMIAYANMTYRRMISISDAYNDVDRYYKDWKYKAIRQTRSNNWLKSHGYPMRRRWEEL